MAITQGLCNSFKRQLLEGVHDFTGDVIKIALFTDAADLDSSTTAYTTSGEVSDAGTNYTAGGETLTNIAPSLSGTTAIADFEDVTWASATLTARGALIYNSSKSNSAIMVLDFGADKTVVTGNLTVTFPDADATNAIIRIA